MTVIYELELSLTHPVQRMHIIVFLHCCLDTYSKSRKTRQTELSVSHQPKVEQAELHEDILLIMCLRVCNQKNVQRLCYPKY